MSYPVPKNVLRRVALRLLGCWLDSGVLVDVEAREYGRGTAFTPLLDECSAVIDRLLPSAPRRAERWIHNTCPDLAATGCNFPDGLEPLHDTTGHQVAQSGLDEAACRLCITPGGSLCCGGLRSDCFG